MTTKTVQAIQGLEQAKSDGFRSVQLRTQRLTPVEAVEVIRSLPADDGFDPDRVAEHVASLPSEVGEGVQISKSARRTVIAASLPGPSREAYAWAHELVASQSAAGVKMNFGPDKATDLKVFWGKPDVNTLIDIGGDEDL